MEGLNIFESLKKQQCFSTPSLVDWTNPRRYMKYWFVSSCKFIVNLKWKGNFYGQHKTIILIEKDNIFSGIFHGSSKKCPNVPMLMLQVPSYCEYPDWSFIALRAAKLVITLEMGHFLGHPLVIVVIVVIVGIVVIAVNAVLGRRWNQKSTDSLTDWRLLSYRWI